MYCSNLSSRQAKYITYYTDAESSEGSDQFSNFEDSMHSDENEEDPAGTYAKHRQELSPAAVQQCSSDHP